jgi:hypothetical protein
MFLPLEEEQKQWPRVMLPVQLLVVAQWLLMVRPERVSYEQLYSQYADQPCNNI